MISKKTVIILYICLVMVSGCIQTQRGVVTQTPEPVYQPNPAPLAGSIDDTGNQDTGLKSIDQPAAFDGFGDLDTIEEEDLVSSERRTVRGVLPSMAYTNDRIFEYGRKLDRWKELDRQSSGLNMSQEDSEKMVNCFQELRKVLDGYNSLRANMLQMDVDSSSIIIGSEEVMNLQKSDIIFLEGICGRLLGSGEGEIVDWEQRAEGADLPQIETLIERYNSNKEYEEVVQSWLQIPENQRDRVHLRTKIHFANGLMFLHQEEKAAEMYQQIVDEMSATDIQRTDLLSLRKLLADLYTASGNYPAAEKQYVNISKDYSELGELEEWSQLQLDILERSEKGSPELTAFSKLLRNYLGFVAERDGYKLVWEAEDFLQNYPYSAIASNVDIIKNDVKKKADRWFNGFMTNVSHLANDKKFIDGIEILETVPDDIISAEQKETIKTKNDDLILAEAVERETRKIERMQELQHRWNEGMLLVDVGNYDDAIEIFNTLLETEYYAKAEDKIKEISLRAAKSDRRKAADLFLRYTKTTDLESKKKLLIESRRLLTEILIKYPEVDIIEKVMGNIGRVEQEMNTLDPRLLQSLQSSGQAMVDDSFSGGSAKMSSLKEKSMVNDSGMVEEVIVE